MIVKTSPFIFPPSPEKRSKGLHLSDIVRAIEKDILGPEKRPDMTPDQERRLMAMFEMGHLWERAWQIAMGERYAKGKGRGVYQGEIKVDGIWMTPDWYDAEGKVVEEYKRSKVSTNTIEREGIERKWPGYLIQLKSYCRALKTTRGKLIVDFINGNYKYGTPEGQEQVWVFEIEFTRQELEENWIMVLNKKRELEAGKGKGAGDGGSGAVVDVRRVGARGGDGKLGLFAHLGSDRPRRVPAGREGAGEAGGGSEVEPLPWARGLDFAALDEEGD